MKINVTTHQLRLLSSQLDDRHDVILENDRYFIHNACQRTCGPRGPTSEKMIFQSGERSFRRRRDCPMKRKIMNVTNVF